MTGGWIERDAFFISRPSSPPIVLLRRHRHTLLSPVSTRKQAGRGGARVRVLFQSDLPYRLGVDHGETQDVALAGLIPLQPKERGGAGACGAPRRPCHGYGCCAAGVWCGVWVRGLDLSVMGEKRRSNHGFAQTCVSDAETVPTQKTRATHAPGHTPARRRGKCAGEW